MPQYVAFLRGINLGNRRIKMDDLKALFEELPFTEVATYIASGNVMFTSSARSATKLEATIATHLEKRLGYPVPTLVRTRREVTDIVTHAPLGDLFTDSPVASTQVTFFTQPLPDDLAAGICEVRTATDRFAVKGRELYWRCATRLSDSVIWQNPKQNPHSLPAGTTRNLNTLRKLVELYPA